MMKKFFLLFFLSVIFLGFQQIFAQSSSPTAQLPDWVRKNEDKRREMDKVNGKDNRGMIEQPRPVSISPETVKAKNKQKVAEAEKQARIAEINQQFAPPAEYLTKYAEFLKQKNSGIARMFPDKNCGEGKIVSVQELERCGETPQIKGAGSLYSFKLLNIPSYMPLELILYHIGQSEMRFVNDRLYIESPKTLGIIGEIGEMDIDAIDLKNESVNFLKKIKFDKNKEEFEARKKSLEKGITSGERLFSTSAVVKSNSTYILRSITYKRSPRFPATFWEKDLIVAFKIIEQENDGSIIMLWKILREKDAPYLGN